MKRLVVGILKFLLNAEYRVCCARPRGNTALFLSRQSNKPSDDFRRIAAQIEALGWQASYSIKMLNGGLGAKLAYGLNMFADVRRIARCHICFVEGYNPVLSLLNLNAQELHSNTRNHEAPIEPVVIQIWHAGGMYKKFGFQCTGTEQGRSETDAELFRMHRNYSWIVCSGSAAQPVYAQAFGYPVERTVALGRATCDRLYENDPAIAQRVLKAYPQLEHKTKPVVVFAPTLRRHADSSVTFDAMKAKLKASSWAQDFELIWSGHPVMTPEEKRIASTTDLLHFADLLVTDYSATVYDAAILGVPALFYVPDIDEYRETPGLNTDPMVTSPAICAQTAEELMEKISRYLGVGTGAASNLETGSHYPQAEFDAFVSTTLDACTPGSAKRIAEFAVAEAEKQVL